MAFVDEVRIFLKAGDGGKGCESFYRDKYARYPKPDGGDGGKGGNVVFVADRRIHTLLDYRFKQHYQGERGGHASSKGKNGRSGKDCVLRIPVGTILREYESKLLIKDLAVHGERVLVAQGGNGGRGNKNNRTPVAPGKGEERTVHLELKLIADIGLIGFPNAGKSTLICNVSKVKSKIANYPFTTKQPILGVVQGEEFDMIIADLPGIIEGAHTGKGLGDRFLKHAERTKVLVHLIDMAGTEGRDPLEDYEKIRNEILQYGRSLAHKKIIVVANKMDLPDAKQHFRRFRKKYRGREILPVSALEKDNLVALVKRLNHIISKTKRS